MTVHYYGFPTDIHFGAGAVRGLPDYLASRAVHRPLVVTDRGLAELPVVTETVGMLRAAGLDAQVFAGIWGNPVKSMVDAGVGAVRDAKADAVVGMGGGAAMDVAKLVALMAHHPGDVLDYAVDAPEPRPVDRDMPAFVTVPTTAGTGSEVGRAAVVSEDDTHVKRIVFHRRLLAQHVFVDPELILDLPASVTAFTGMDALTHLVEAFLSLGYHPMCDGIALEGIRLVERSLRACVDFARKPGDRSPEHLAARGDMMNAALMGAVAFQKGLGVTHSCAHALSTLCDLHHGQANGILLPYAMAFNAETEPERFTRMAQAVGLPDPTPAAFVQWLRDLKTDIGVPATLREVGVADAQVDALVDVARRDPCLPENPRPAGPPELRRIYTEALG